MEKIKINCETCGDRIETIDLNCPHIWVCDNCERDWEWKEESE